MTTTLPRPDETVQKPAEALAMDGGPRAVASPARDRWRHVRLLDALPILAHLARGVNTGFLPSGPIGDFERRFAGLTGVELALAMNSGTAALHAGLFAVGVGAGDEVILPTYTFHASASAVRCCGARPVFCDIDPRTLTADPRDIAQRVTPRTKALMAVHVWGNPCAMDAIRAVADKHGLPIIEDCSHAHGASYRGRSVGAWGEVGCFSLQGLKAVSAGEGGVAVCSDPRYFDRMLALGHPVRVGVDLERRTFDIGIMHLGPKYRPHLFAVLLADASLRRLPKLNRLRQRNWDILNEELAGCRAIRPVETLPGAQRGGFLEFLFVMAEELKGRGDRFVQAVRAEGVPARFDRYGYLHDAPIYRMGGPLEASCLEDAERRCEPAPHLPAAEGLRGRLISMDAMAKVPERFMRQCARGLRKVAEHLRGS